MLTGRMRTDLREAPRARDAVAVAALRSALAAVADAEAQPSPGEPSRTTTSATSEDVTGAAVGVGATEVERKQLSADDALAVVVGEVAERRSAAQQLREAGRPDRAERADAEADVLVRYC